MVSLNRFDGSCNLLDDKSGKMCVPNQTDFKFKCIYYNNKYE